MNGFSPLGVSTPLVRVLQNQGINSPYPIQLEAIPSILEKHDIMGIAQTGSGKTLSYVLPMLMNLQGVRIDKNRHVNGLILVPTRELAVQVEKVFRSFRDASPFPLKVVALYGGASINPQMQSAQGASIAIATPGRLLDLVEHNAIHLSSVKMLVVDEADKLLNLGFKEELDKILKLLPSRRQNLLFSATLDNRVEEIQSIALNKPKIIEIEPQKTTVELIKQTGYFVEQDQKGTLLRYLIKEKSMKQVLVFVSSTRRADLVTNKLKKNGIQAASIHSKKQQGARNSALDLFKNNGITVLVATDLLARGIDIEFLPFVVNYELPRSPKDFIHRIGRTGRAENPGEAITFVTPEDQHHFKVIQKKMKRRVDMVDFANLSI